MNTSRRLLPVVHFFSLVMVALITLDAVVSAEDVVIPAGTHGNTTIQLGTAYQYLEPFLMAVFTAILGLLLGVVRAYLKKKTGLDVDQQSIDRVNLACANAAGRILAGQESRFAHASIDVHSPLIAAEIPKVSQYAADAIQAMGYTPEHVADLVLAHVGRLQAQATAGSVLDAPHV